MFETTVFNTGFTYKENVYFEIALNMSSLNSIFNLQTTNEYIFRYYLACVAVVSTEGRLVKILPVNRQMRVILPPRVKCQRAIFTVN